MISPSEPCTGSKPCCSTASSSSSSTWREGEHPHLSASPFFCEFNPNVCLLCLFGFAGKTGRPSHAEFKQPGEPPLHSKDKSEGFYLCVPCLGSIHWVFTELLKPGSRTLLPPNRASLDVVPPPMLNSSGPTLGRMPRIRNCRRLGGFDHRGRPS